MNSIEIDAPTDMTSADVAKVFSEYLQAGVTGKVGPFKDDNAQKYQLDGTNDYWLHTDGEVHRLTWRYDGQREIAEPMVALFNARFN